MKTCTYQDGEDRCQNLVEGRTEYCASHNLMFRNQDRVKLKEAKKSIKKVSDKRSGELQQYARLRKEYMEAYPACEVTDCHRKSSELHHMAGRENGKLLDTNYFLAVCHEHHYMITVDSKWAIENGYSVLRTTVNNQTV